jgi:triphosphatase
MSLESELKFRVAKRKFDGFTRLRIAGARAEEVTRRRLVSSYFDTPKQKLHRHWLTLRVRQSGDQYQQTIKAASAASFARGEWESDIGGARPDFRQIGDTPLTRIATKKTRRKTKPIFQTTIERFTRPVYVGPSGIELAGRSRQALRGGRSKPIAEFELELKKGHAAAPFRVARELERRLGAELDLSSKADHGYRLANGETGPAVHAEPINVTNEMTTRDAFKAIGYATLRHFSGNADGVRALDAEAVHQMRVGLRRLRAAISLFDDILPGPSTARIKEELKWLTGELAPARELDVFLAEQIKPLGRAGRPKRGFRAIEKHFSGRRRTAFQNARDALGTPRYRRLLIDVLEWLALRNGRDAESAETTGEFVAALMQRRTRKVQKGGRRLDKLSPRERHKLRIKVKKIRYALDFFENLYPAKADKELKEFSASLKKIQNALGTLNGFIAHRSMATAAALRAPSRDRRARAFASGLLVGHEQEASRTLIKSAAKALRCLQPLRTKPS